MPNPTPGPLSGFKLLSISDKSLPDIPLTHPAKPWALRRAKELDVAQSSRHVTPTQMTIPSKEIPMSDAHGVARDQLRAFVERIERLEEEKKTIADDIKDVYGEAKGMGFDTKILKKVIALRKKDEQERMEEDLILDTYLHALGMIENPPEG
ncbi:hypothetical protein RvVAR0630_10310 [Agrobacterium vitis]|nr:hypothetical protein RvVAR0630_10310 [Agrobacterium vitis]